MSGLIPKPEAREEAKRRLSQKTDWPSGQVCARIARHHRFQSARRVGLFVPRSWEVDLLDLWRERPDACVFPKVISRGKMSFFRIRTLESLKPGYAKILEPQEGEPVSEWGESDLILVPGYAFDLKGGRVGTGRGYYDRFLDGLPAEAWGACWETQIVSGTLAQERTDVRMSALCTERRVLFLGAVK